VEFLIARVYGSRIGEKSIGLEQSDTEDERQGCPTLRRPHDARLRLDRPERLFKDSQPLRACEIALFEQNDIAVTELAASSLALELVKAKAVGIDDRDDRIDTHPIPQLRAQEGQHHRQWIGDATRLDNQVIDPMAAVENAKDRIQKIVVD